jgi:hypothetical protein
MPMIGYPLAGTGWIPDPPDHRDYTTKTPTSSIGWSAVCIICLAPFVNAYSCAALAQSTQAQAPPNYVFDEAHPPRLSDFKGAILSIPVSERTRSVGIPSKWDNVTTVTHYSTDCPFNCTNTITAHNTLERYWHWEIIVPPKRFGPAVENNREYKEGYSKTQRDEFERSLGMSVTAGGSIVGVNLSGTIKSDLKFDTVATTDWHEEQTVKEQFTNAADTIYVTWGLVDTLHLSKLKHNDIKYNCGFFNQLCGKQYKIIDVPEESLLDVTIASYTDHMDDSGGGIIKKLQSDAIR